MKEKTLSFLLVALGMAATVGASAGPAKMHPAQSNAAIHIPYQSDVMNPKNRMQVPVLPLVSRSIATPAATPAKAAQRVEAPNAEILLYENFSMLTDGSEEELGTDLVPYYAEGDPFIPEEYIGEDGWYGFGLYSAGEKIALAYPGVGGSLNTPEQEMYGRLIVTTRVKAREGNTGSVLFFINCVKGDWMNSEPVEAVNRIPDGQEGAASQTYSQKAEDGWVDITTVIYNPYQGDDCWIQVNAYSFSKAGIMIDEIKIERDYDFCMAPSNLISYDFTDDGFTARWEPGANNTSFLFSLMEERREGDNVVREESFDTIEISDDGNISEGSVPEDIVIWLGEGNQATADLGYEGSQALILDSSSDVVMLPDNGNPLVGGSIYVKSNVEEGSFANLYIIGINGYSSEIAGGIRLYEYTTEGALLDLNDFVANISSYTSLGFQVYYMEEGDEVILDQISWTTLAPTVTEIVREDIPVDSNIIQITGLDPEYDYSFSVKGVSETGLVSDSSPYKLALGCPAPNALPATDIDCAGSYVANWQPSVKAKSYLVRNFENYTVKEDTDNYSVLWDVFINAYVGGDIEYINGNSFDGIADMNGWTGTHGIYSDCSIGAVYGGDVVTPPLNLSYDEGKFKVRVVAQLVSGCGLNVQCNTTSYQTFMAPEPLFGDVTFEEYEFEFEFEDGAEMTNIMFYGTNTNGFLLNEVEITQNVKKGDKEIVFISEKVVDGHDTDNTDFSDLTVSDEYDFAYTVSGIGQYRDRVYMSSPSNIVEVNMNTVRVDEVVTEGLTIALVNGKIKVDLAEEAVISVYSVDGTVIYNCNGVKGENFITIPTTGVYIVKIGSVVKKVRI